VFSRFRSRSCVGELNKEVALGSATKRNPIRRLTERFGWLGWRPAGPDVLQHTSPRRNASCARLRRGAPALLPALQLSRRAMQPAAARQNGLGRGQPGQGFKVAAPLRRGTKVPAPSCGFAGAAPWGGRHGQADQRVAAADLHGRVHRERHIRRNPAPLNRRANLVRAGASFVVIALIDAAPYASSALGVGDGRAAMAGGMAEGRHGGHPIQLDHLSRFLGLRRSSDWRELSAQART